VGENEVRARNDLVPAGAGAGGCWYGNFLNTGIDRITALEYAGAFLGIAGWLGVRQVSSPAAQACGFFVWIVSGLILIAWGHRTGARAIILINSVNVLMAASAFFAII